MVHYLGCNDGFLDICLAKLITLCSLNMCSLLYTNYTYEKMIMEAREIEEYKQGYKTRSPLESSLANLSGTLKYPYLLTPLELYPKDIKRGTKFSLKNYL